MSDLDRTGPDNNAVHNQAVHHPVQHPAGDSVVHYIVTGLVQGVGFRMFTQRAGRELSLDGIVRNLSDGSVECVVRYPAGEDANRLRARFEARLHRGPPHGRVDHVAVQDPATTGQAALIGRGFRII